MKQPSEQYVGSRFVEFVNVIYANDVKMIA